MVTAPPCQPPCQVTRPKVAPPLNAWHKPICSAQPIACPPPAGWCLVKFSGAHHLSQQALDYPDARPFHEMPVRATSELLIWGSDWRHPRVEGEMTDAGHLFELQKWMSDDKARQRIVVKKPARLYRFTD
jgi:hypothetical protein